MLALYTYLMNWLNNKEGQSMAEYALIIALIAVVVIVILGTVGTNISTVFSSIASSLTIASGG